MSIVDKLTQWDDAKIRRVMMATFACLAGLLLSLITSILACGVYFFIFPFGLILDMASPEDVKELMKTVEASAFIMEAIIWAASIFAGGYMSVRIAKQGGYLSWIVGLMMIFLPFDVVKPFQGLGVIATFLALPHPGWIMVLAIILSLAAAYGGGIIGLMVNANTSGIKPSQKKSKPARSPRPQMGPVFDAPISEMPLYSSVVEDAPDQTPSKDDYGWETPATQPDSNQADSASASSDSD